MYKRRKCQILEEEEDDDNENDDFTAVGVSTTLWGDTIRKFKIFNAAIAWSMSLIGLSVDDVDCVSP